MPVQKCQNDMYVLQPAMINITNDGKPDAGYRFLTLNSNDIRTFSTI